MITIINKAREFLIKQDISSFQADLTRLKFEKTVYFDTFANYARLTGTPAVTRAQIPDGCTYIHGGVHVILVHENARIGTNGFDLVGESKRARWTLAHEIGHDCSEHIGGTLEEETFQERQADCFAGELLVPELVVLELQRRLERKIGIIETSRLFGISQSAAQSVLSRIWRKERFSPFLKEELIYKYKHLIENYVKLSSNQFWGTGGRSCQTVLIR